MNGPKTSIDDFDDPDGSGDGEPTSVPEHDGSETTGEEEAAENRERESPS
ncbi:MAG: hypothetical protein JWO77_716 [Ilumatobacteraceae bacterium]|nr:hypothetical protein [Ilumatobacteraceae bacterium]